MTCRELTDFLMDYLAGELPLDARGEFEHHLSLCANCRTYLNQYRQTVAASRSAFPEPDERTPADVPDELVGAIMAARSRLGRR